MAFKPGESGFKGRKHQDKGKKNPGAGHTLAALTKLRREPVAELIKIADAAESTDLKISLWKYLLERRDAGLELAGVLELGQQKSDLEALEKVIPAAPTTQAS